MALQDFLSDLDRLAADGVAAFESAGDAAALEAARVEFLGAKSGRLKAVQKGLGAVAGPDKPAAGKRFNEVKVALDAALDAAQERLSGGAAAETGEPFDPTVPGGREFEKGRHPFTLGHLHPLTQTIEELKDIMGRLGFTVAEGPEVEDEWHNFEALNIPASHPARSAGEFLSGHGGSWAYWSAAVAQSDQHGANSGDGKAAAAGADYFAGASVSA